MMRYIIIATVFLFQIGYIMCTVNTMFMEHGNEVDILTVKFMVSIYRVYPITRTSDFICVGVLVNKYFIATAATCFNSFHDDAKMEIYFDSLYRGEGEIHENTGIVFDPQTRGQNKNIALVKLAKSVTYSFKRVPAADYIVPGARIKVIAYAMYSMPTGRIYYKLRSIMINVLNISAQHLPRFSFAANNTISDRNILDIDDVGSPAFINGVLVGLLIWANNDDINSPAIFINIFDVNYFIVENMRE